MHSIDFPLVFIFSTMTYFIHKTHIFVRLQLITQSDVVTHTNQLCIFIQQLCRIERGSEIVKSVYR